MNTDTCGKMWIDIDTYRQIWRNMDRDGQMWIDMDIDSDGQMDIDISCRLACFPVNRSMGLAKIWGFQPSAYQKISLQVFHFPN